MPHSKYGALEAILVILLISLAQSIVTEIPCISSKGGEPRGFLWHIDREPPSYFFGTIHVPYTKVSTSPVVRQAFKNSNNVYFELDLTNPETISALAECQLLPAGKTLHELLPPDLYKRLRRRLETVRGKMANWWDLGGRKIFEDITDNWENKRPVWVMLMVNALTESDSGRARGTPVLDLHLAQQAVKLKKRTGAVESVQEQCRPLNGLNHSQVLFALNQSLSQQESGEAFTTEQLIHHYNCGNLDPVIFSPEVPLLFNSSATARKIDNYFRYELIYKRNKRLAHRVVELLQTHPKQSFFFAFGAGHFLGNDSVLDFVQAAGVKVTHMSDMVQGNKRTARTSSVSRRSSPSPKHQTFNDLWVRLENPKTRSAFHLPRSHLDDTYLPVRMSRSWSPMESSCYRDCAPVLLLAFVSVLLAGVT